MKKILAVACLGLFFSAQGQVFLPNQNPSPNSNVGINEPSPQARLHISENDNQANCQPALLIDGSVGSTAPGEGPIGSGAEEVPTEGSCTTPYAIRVYENNGSSRNLAFDLAVNGKLELGLGMANITSRTTLGVMNNLSAYGSTQDFLSLDAQIGQAPSVRWNSSSSTLQNQNLEFVAGLNAPNQVRTMSLSPTGNLAVGSIAPNPNFSLLAEDGLLVDAGRVGIGTQTPQTALHVKDNTPSSEINLEGSPSGKINGLLIENNGWRDHDYALQVNTGHGKLFTLSNSGTVHIGDGLNFTTPYDPKGRFRLYVQDGIRTERVRVDIANENGWADYVFDEDYVLMPTAELEAYIKEYKHLPGVPSAKEVVEEGIDLAEMNKILLEKVEELTLRVIELEKASKK
jgi:hypothetical protein